MKQYSVQYIQLSTGETMAYRHCGNGPRNLVLIHGNMGSLNGKSYDTLAIGAPLILVGVLILYLLRWRLNILPLSDDEARASGTNVKALRIVTVLCATAITASCVSMPNLSPPADRHKYMLYDNKAVTGEDAAETLNVLQKHLDEIGYRLVVSRGDYREGKS